MKSKFIIVLFFLILNFQGSYGQLIVNAGNDTTYCDCSATTLNLGGFPTAIGGEEPYTYSWSIIPKNHYGIILKVYYLLNDSTLANPPLRARTIINDTITFILNVTDGNSNTGKDSVNVIISSVACWLRALCEATINQGDSVLISPLSIKLGFDPISYHWKPESDLSDPYSKEPFASPDVTTLYNCFITDATGCTATDGFMVEVIPNGIFSQIKSVNKSFVYPNPIESGSKIWCSIPENEKLTIEVVNFIGQEIINDSFIPDYYNIGEKIYQNGIYSYVIRNKSKILTSGRFIK